MYLKFNSNLPGANQLNQIQLLCVLQMPTLKPEDMSMVGLNLFTQLCNLAKIANASLEEPLEEDKVGSFWRRATRGRQGG